MEALGTNSKLGIAIEAAFTGTPPLPVPAVAQGLLDFRSASITGSSARIESEALRPSRIRRKGVLGSHEITGGVTAELTPDVVSKLLYAALGTKAAATGAGPYVHVLTPKSTGNLPTMTLSRTVGPINDGGLIIYHAGLKVDTLTLRTALDEVVTVDASLMGLKEVVDTNTTARDTAIFGTAAYSANDPFVFTQARVRTGDTLGGVTEKYNIRGVDLEFRNNLIDKRALVQGRRTALLHKARRFEAVATLDTYFEDEFALRKAFGVTGAAYPFEAGTVLGVGALDLLLTSGSNTLLIEMANCEFSAAAPTVEGEDFITQEVTVEIRENINSATSPITLTLTNGESQTAFLVAAPTAIV